MWRTTEGSLTSYLVLHAGDPFQRVSFLNLRISFWRWLTALCRPKERGRQCAVIV